MKASTQMPDWQLAQAIWVHEPAYPPPLLQPSAPGNAKVCSRLTLQSFTRLWMDLDHIVGIHSEPWVAAGFGSAKNWSQLHLSPLQPGAPLNCCYRGEYGFFSHTFPLSRPYGKKFPHLKFSGKANHRIRAQGLMTESTMNTFSSYDGKDKNIVLLLFQVVLQHLCTNILQLSLWLIIQYQKMVTDEQQMQ